MNSNLRLAAGKLIVFTLYGVLAVACLAVPAAVGVVAVVLLTDLTIADIAPKGATPEPRFYVGQTIHLKPAGEAALVIKSQCWPWWGCQYRLRIAGQTERSFWDSDPALP